MGYYNDNLVDDTILEFPKIGFWAVHALGIFLLFGLGMRFAVRRVPLAILAYRFLKMLR